VAITADLPLVFDVSGFWLKKLQPNISYRQFSRHSVFNPHSLDSTPVTDRAGRVAAPSQVLLQGRRHQLRALARAIMRNLTDGADYFSAPPDGDGSGRLDSFGENMPKLVAG
jgi:hypothetical protein